MLIGNEPIKPKEQAQLLKPSLTHDWSLSPTKAIALQKELAQLASFRSECSLRASQLLVAGCDVSYERTNNYCFGAIIVADYQRGQIIEEAVAAAPANFPYVPGLLSFREIPVLLEAFANLQHRPSLLFAEGQGRAHPRRFGLATHLGVIFDLPALGCAKSRLIGHHRTPAERRGASATLLDPANGETIGAVLRTRRGVKPVYVSQGHKLSLAQCLRITLRLTGSCRMPDLLRRAHTLANEARREHILSMPKMDVSFQDKMTLGEGPL
jgi:deoxyribonuclease V